MNIKVVGINIHTSVYDKRDDFGFPIVNFPWLSGDVPTLPSYGIHISQLVRFARCCTSVLISILKIFKSLQNFWHRVTDITSFEKRLGSSLGHTLNFCPNLVKDRFRIMYHKESLTLSSTVILSTNFEGSKAKRIFISSGLKNSETPSTSSVWPSDHREDYRPCARSFNSLVQIFPKALQSN